MTKLLIDESTLTPFARDLIASVSPVRKSGDKGRTLSSLGSDPLGEIWADREDEKAAASAMRGAADSPLVKSLLSILNQGKNTVERLAFETDPSISNEYSGLFRQKLRLIPDAVLKRIQIQDDLVAAIINTRGNQVGAFGRPQTDRFSVGFSIEPIDPDAIEDDQQKEFTKRVRAAEELILTCGKTKGVPREERLSFSQYLFQSTKNAVGLGRIATEVIWESGLGGEKKFHRFRPIDVGTIFRAASCGDAAEELRESARSVLETLKNKRIAPERFIKDEYAWVQVIGGRPVQAFASDECVVHNFYPAVDVELDGYPITPLDTVISAVTMHINITTHNKLYFQSGRASRGMLVIKSDDVDEQVIARVRQQFNSVINNVNNSWRMPVFGVGANEEIAWQAIDSGGRDMEFQYLSDSNARTILSAFQMSPEELPGLSHLSRGTNSQALSEGNQEYLLTAHRDVGIRPLLKQWEDFINETLFPLIDADLSKICVVKLKGLEAETAEKEAIRLQQDAPIHMSYNDVMGRVEKDPIDKLLGGDVPLNPALQQIWDKYVPVGVILEKVFGMEGASQQPQYQYFRDAFWFQFQQMTMQQQQMQAQAQQAQQQQGQGPPDGGGKGGGSPPPQQGGGAPDQQQSANAQNAQQSTQVAQQNAQDNLSMNLDQAQQALGKAEENMEPSKRKLLRQQQAVVDSFMKEWEKATRDAVIEIASEVI